MERVSETNEAVVLVDRKMLYALFAVAWWGVWATAGVIIAFAQRAGASAAVANGTGLSVAALLMYPYFAIRLKMRAAEVPQFSKWALHWIVTSAIGTFIVTRVMDALWP
jgi:hypothetical protein